MLQKSIGIIGVGLLGTAIAERLKTQGWKVIGFDVDAMRLTHLQSIGGQCATTAVEVIEKSSRVILSLPTSEIAGSVVTEIESAFGDDTILIDTTTGDPDVMAEIGRRLKQRGAEYLDATVAGSSQQAREGDVVLMVGGDELTVEKCRDLFDAMSRSSFHVGPCGSGARMKLVVNLVLGLNRAVLAEGLAFAEAAGIDLGQAIEVLKVGPAYSTVMETKGRKMIDGDFAPQARLAQHQKDVRLILDQAAKNGAALPLSALHERILQHAVELGFGDQDNSAVISALRAWPREDSPPSGC